MSSIAQKKVLNLKEFKKQMKPTSFIGEAVKKLICILPPHTFGDIQ